ncbi:MULTISPECIES: hypothetical protein [Sphingobium]|jgi:type IV pilus biogenesis protein CpaD/CtpE|uniref:hypothetical protein n=1 Tax=Sphingobium TaxID=165695 RepID=UPI002100889A|nr:hypothetical protein [Sphingobium sp. 15-1]
MSNMRKLSFAVLLLAPALTACTANDPTFGGAVRSNYAMQVVNPEPQHEGTLVEGGEGTRSAAAVERYRKGAVKEPSSISTTQGSSSSR